MLLVFPYCSNDLHLAEALAKWLPRLGPYFGHDLLLAPSAAVAGSVEGIQAQLKPIFRNTYVYVVAAPERPWPLGTSKMFYAIGMHIHQSIPGVTNGWYYFEVDNCPTRVGWLDEFGYEYANCGRPFMGVTCSTMWQDGRGDRHGDGVHMVGTGVYPRDLAKRSPLFRALKDAPQPFDTFMQWEIVPQCHVTRLIHHEWSTHKYTRDKKTGVIIGQLSRDYRSWAPKPIPSEAAVVHGCKDLSLMNIYRGLLTGPRAHEKELVEA